jgi:predicted aspartyl protease
MSPTSSVGFHAFTIRHSGRVQRIITDIFVSEAFDPAKQDPRQFKRVPAKALWDTGATGSVVTPRVVADLELKPTGQVKIQHAGGASDNLTYVVNIGLPNNVAIVGVLVSECPNIVGNFDALIGMDIITNGDFAITNTDNLTVMSFRIPSIECIDYVRVAERLRFAGVGRNDPCPCGQLDLRGKPVKFKRCHGKNI